MATKKTKKSSSWMEDGDDARFKAVPKGAAKGVPSKAPKGGYPPISSNWENQPKMKKRKKINRKLVAGKK